MGNIRGDGQLLVQKRKGTVTRRVGARQGEPAPSVATVSQPNTKPEKLA
jgi:hypothetical protein